MSVFEILQTRDNLQQDYKDIEVVNSFVEYSGKGDLSYLLFELKAKNGTGEYIHLYKAIKLHRLIRVPKNAKRLKSYMDMQGEVLASFYRSRINFIQIIANIIEPKPLGLLFIYGVQAVSTQSMEVAKQEANNDFAALIRAFQGTFRTMETRYPSNEEMEWLRNKMHTMNHVQMIRGLPAPRKAPGEMNNTSGMGGRGDSETQETNEQFIIGMSDYEYVAVLVAQPIEEEVLNQWLNALSKDETKWAGLHQGSRGLNFGLSMPMMFMSNLGSSEGWSQGFSQTDSINHTDSTSISDTVSHGTSTTMTDSTGVTEGTTHSTGITDTTGRSEGTSHTVSDGTSTSHSISKGDSTTETTTTGRTVSDGTSEATTKTTGTTHTKSISETSSKTETFTDSESDGFSSNIGNTAGTGTSANEGKTNTKSAGIGGPIPMTGANMNFGVAQGESKGHGTNDSLGTNEGAGQTKTLGSSVAEGFSKGDSKGTSDATSNSTAIQKGSSHTVSESKSESIGSSKSTTESWGTGTSHTESRGTSTTESVSQSKSQSEAQSRSLSNTHSVAKGVSDTVSHGKTVGSSDGWGKSTGQNQGFQGGIMSGTAGSTGIGPSLSWSKTFQWKDIEVDNILQLLEFQRSRLITATNGQGAFFVDFFIATPSEEAKQTAKTVAMAAWVNRDAFVSPLQVLELPAQEEKHLLYHMNVFSPCLVKEGIPGQLESYKYSTVLLADEVVAYSHPPRISEGGVYAEVEDMPVLSIPSNRQDGEIYVGKILSGERYSTETGYETRFPFRIRSDEIMHAFFAGGSRSGKTVTATRVVAEMANHVRRGPHKKRMRIIAMDPKQDWRILAKFIEPERFRFYSLADPDFLPVKLNLCKIPKNVWPERYMNSVVEIFCRSYGLGERGKQILTRAFFEEYTRVGCFKHDWRIFATDRSADITMETIYKNLAKKREEMDDPQGKVKYGNDARDAFTRVLDRMEAYGRKGSIVHSVFCDPNGQGIDELLGKDDVVVLESYGLESTTRSFVFGLITAGIYQYCVHNGGFVKPEDQYETVLVIEEANEVLLGQDSASGDSNGGLSGPSEFERIVDQAAGNGLFIWAITQKISMMPTSIIANCGLVFAGRQKIPDDINVCVRQVAREERYDDRNLVKWFPRSPTGIFVVQTSRTSDFKDAEPAMVKVEQLSVSPPTNEELEHIMKMRQVKLLQNVVSV